MLKSAKHVFAVAMFSDFDLSITEIGRRGLGPVLVREETEFLREINLLEIINVTCELAPMRSDGS